MPIRQDYFVDIHFHRRYGKALALNLCEDSECLHPHSASVKLDGFSERQSCGAGSGTRICFICEKECGLKHDDFDQFVYCLKDALGIKGSWSDRVKIWRVVVQSGLDDKFRG